jgi:hypothetical protein
MHYIVLLMCNQEDYFASDRHVILVIDSGTLKKN